MVRNEYRFGEFSLDPVAKVLSRNGLPVHMTRKAVETLLVLVKNPGQVVTKEEIISAVWGDRVVDEANLAQNIAVVRKILAAGKGDAAHIETFPGRGYRIEGPVVQSIEEARPAVHRVVALAATGAAPAPLPEVATAAPPHHESRTRRWTAMAAAVLAVAIAIAVIRRDAPPATEYRVTPLTRLPGREFQPAFAPDGEQVAFVASEGALDGPAIWVGRLGDPSPRRLTAGSAAHHSSPAWSPDGRHLAFLRITRTATEIVIVPTGGGAERVVTSLSPPDYGLDHRLLDWSPDGQTLAVAHADSPGHPTALWLVSVASGDRRVLTQPSVKLAGDADPRFSPDGARVSFLRATHRSKQEIFSVPAAGGGEPRQLTAFERRISGHDWMDQDTLVAASERTGEFRLWRIAAGAGTPTASPFGVYGEFPMHLSVAPRGGGIAYAALNLDRNIWRLEIANRSWTRVAASTGQDASPQLSPKGDRLCFRSDRSGEEHLWVSNADGSSPVQVTRGDMHPSVGRWSPDGRSIAFNDPRSADIFIATESGGSWSIRKIGAQGVHPAFSSDGRWIYAGGSSIVRLPAGGGPVEVVKPGRAEALSLSLDGKYLYFVRDRNDSALSRLVLATGEVEQVVTGIVPGCTSCWAASEQDIYYLAAGKQSFDEQVLRVRGLARGGDREVLRYPEPLWPQGSGPFSLSPDGRYLYAVRVDPSNSDVMVVSPAR